MQHRQRISRVIGYAPVGRNGRTRRLLLTAALAVLVAWIALGWADHSEPSVLIWLLSPGLPLALHVPVAATGFLNGLAKVAMIALLIDFAYYAALIYAGLSWVSQRQTR